MVEHLTVVILICLTFIFKPADYGDLPNLETLNLVKTLFDATTVKGTE